eukprot:XP_014775188.1 PREDICTED: uncharacterized protein LOC106872641 [Octopus bimaculoides]
MNIDQPKNPTESKVISNLISRFSRGDPVRPNRISSQNNSNKSLNNKVKMLSNKHTKNDANTSCCNNVNIYSNNINKCTGLLDLTLVVKSNFNSKEWKNLRDLQQDKSLTIKEADKGSTVVLMDTDFYKHLVLSLLNDHSFYETITNYKQQKTLKNLTTLILQHGQGLTDKEKDYIINFKCKPSLFYGFPKIHKNKSITEAYTLSSDIYINIKAPEDLKLRPIIAGTSCKTHRLSNFLDILFKPFLSHIKSFIRDDLDILNHLPKTTNEEAFLVSFDVVNLYTNIPHEFAIEAIKFWLEKHPEAFPNCISTTFITESLKFTLTNNYFLFAKTYYRQKCGIAMGTKAAPVLANLIMVFFLNITI